MYESLAFHVFFFKQKTAYEVRISDWSSDVCSSDLLPRMRAVAPDASVRFEEIAAFPGLAAREDDPATALVKRLTGADAADKVSFGTEAGLFQAAGIPAVVRSEEHTSELQSLMRTSYAVFCLKKNIENVHTHSLNENIR